MSNHARNIMDQIRAGKLDLTVIEKMSAGADQPIAISNWKLCYGSLLKYLRGSCTLTPKTGNKIAEAYLIIAKDQNGPLMCSTTVVGYNGISDGKIDVYTDTDLYTPDMGSSLLFVVFGSLQNSENFQFYQVMPVGAC